MTNDNTNYEKYFMEKKSNKTEDSGMNFFDKAKNALKNSWKILPIGSFINFARNNQNGSNIYTPKKHATSELEGFAHLVYGVASTILPAAYLTLQLTNGSPAPQKYSELQNQKTINYEISNPGVMLEERDGNNFATYKNNDLGIKVIPAKKESGLAKKVVSPKKVKAEKKSAKSNSGDFSYEGTFNGNKISACQKGDLKALVMEDEEKILYATDFDGQPGFETMNLIYKNSGKSTSNIEVLEKYLMGTPLKSHITYAWDMAKKNCK